jgi:excisionase family DNA binding protein
MRSHHKEQIEITEHPAFLDYVARVEAMNLPELIRVTRVAQLLDLDRRRVYEMVENAELAAVRVGTRGVRIFRDSLLDWLRAGGSGWRQ